MQIKGSLRDLFRSTTQQSCADLEVTAANSFVTLGSFFSHLWSLFFLSSQPGRVIYQPPVTVPHNQFKPKPTQHSCPLTGVEAHVIIKDFCASIALSQQFQNVEEHPIEAVYQFPLNEKYCICDFTAEIDGKVIKGECKEKEEAKVNLFCDLKSKQFELNIVFRTSMRMPSQVDTVLTCWKRMVNSSSATEFIAKSNAFSQMIPTFSKLAWVIFPQARRLRSPSLTLLSSNSSREW